MTKIQGSWRLQVMGSWLTLVWKIKQFYRGSKFLFRKVFVWQCAAVALVGHRIWKTQWECPALKDTASVYIFSEKLITWVFKRKWENRLIRKCEGRETVPFPSRKKAYITIKYKGNLRSLVMGDITSERNTYHQSLRTLKKSLISKFRQCKHQLASISPN